MARGIARFPRSPRLLVTPLAGVLLAGLLLAGCGSSNPSPSAPVSGSSGSSASFGPSASPLTPAGSSGGPTAAPSPTAAVGAPTPTAFWARAASALVTSTRLRIVVKRPEPLELRYEPAASGAATHGTLQTLCLGGVWYTIQHVRATPVRGKWLCGTSALVTSFRTVGQPLESWNSTLPTNTRVKEAVTIVANNRWQWRYTARSAALGGVVVTTLLLDPTSGRIISGQRTDPRGTTTYVFSYTAIFLPIELP